MALPLIAGLNALARAALPIIRGGVARGLPSRAIQGAIRTAFGKGIRNQTLLDIIRAEKGIAQLGAQLKFLSKKAIPNPFRLPAAITKIRRRYSFVVQVVGFVIQTGETRLKNITVATDTLLSRETLEALAERALIDGDSDPLDEITKSTLISGVQAGEAGFLG